MAKSESSARGNIFSRTNQTYISCIKIHGLRILPPILTEEKRQQMQYYKELAIKVEEKLRNKIILPILNSTDDCQNYFESKSSSSMNESGNNTSDEEPTYKSQIFSESCRSDILKMLNDSPKVPLKNNESDTKCLKENMTDLPEKIPTENNTKPNLSSDPTLLFSSEQTEKTNVEIDKSSSILCENGAGDSESPKKLENNSPVLIRSNSYTLDSPSPFLIAFMKQQKNALADAQKTNENGKKRRTWDLEKAREKWSSIEHDLNIVADKTMGKKCDSFNSLPPSSTTSPENKMFNNRLSHSEHFPEKDIPTLQKRNEKKRASTAPTKTSDSRFLNSFITPLRPTIPVKDTTPKKYDKNTDLKRTVSPFVQRKIAKDNVKQTIILPKRPDILTCKKSEQQIREFIDKIHREQSKQMSELIARQKKEQEILMKMFAEQQALLLSKMQSTYQNTNETNDEQHKTNDNENKTQSEVQLSTVSEPDILKNSENLLFECKQLLQQETLSVNSESSILYSPILSSSPSDSLSNETLKTLTPTNPNELIIESTNTSRFSNSSFSTDSLDTLRSKTKLKQSCSRQLFPAQKQIWAATKINAFARGFLVRRLIKTEKVQNLIKTIRDTLVCAMELHHETADKIQPADVELHRRLIQQVTAACYTFNDTFFELSRSDQLSIIATDRERQKEKLLRPASAKSNTTLSSTTQRVLERKMRRSSDSTCGAPSRSSSSRSCHSANEFRLRTKSLGLSESLQSDRKTSPQNDVMHRAMSYGANKKPWR